MWEPCCTYRVGCSPRGNINVVRKIETQFLITTFAFLFSIVVLHRHLEKVYTPNYPHLKDLVTLNEPMAIQDTALIALGFRSVAADVAWIQLLQYFGGGSVFDLEDNHNGYPSVQPLTLRVMRMDPYFVEAIMFGTVSLAWIKLVNRPQEAMELLREAVHYNPSYWPLQGYIVSIGYQANDQFENMLGALADTLQNPDCPLQVKAIVANTFKLHKKYHEALKIWLGIYNMSDDPGTKNRAMQQIKELQGKISSSSN